MVIVKIFQGPGNQLFQVAFGLAAAQRLNTELKVDLSWYKDYSHHRQFVLDKFDLNINTATEKEIYDIVTCNASNYISYQWNRLNRLHLRPYYQRPKIVESLNKFDINYTRILDDTYVEGYFTSRDFFATYLDLVKSQFQFKSPPSDSNKQLIDKIRSENAVAISFRLGDFLTNPLHNVCSLQYYQRSIEYLTSRYSDLRFYLFSDDLNWVKANFKIPHQSVFMDANGADYMEDFRLLTHFKFHIVPNSTFSWWGAELANNEGKVVLAPEFWLNPDLDTHKDAFGDQGVDFTHIVPNEWIKIPNMLPGDTYIG